MCLCSSDVPVVEVLQCECSDDGGANYLRVVPLLELIGVLHNSIIAISSLPEHLVR